MVEPTSLDFQWMAHALRLAEQGLTTTTPNPRVGCVVVKNNQIVGVGAHIKAGESHAEVFALRQAGTDAKGADVYVTLEPCSHVGKTPPCVDAVIASQPKRVVIAMQDPNPLVAGRGVAKLRAQGIEVLLGVMEQEAQALNSGFVSRMVRGLPLVRSKVAASLDGRTALKNGQSQWITSDAARLDVQHWRARSCAMITGVGTVLADNPSLTVRIENTTRQPSRIIVDSQLQTPITAKLFDRAMLQQSPVIIAYAEDTNNKASRLMDTGAELLFLPNAQKKVDLRALLQTLASRGMNEVLVEAGQRLNGSLLNAHLIDELILYYAPKLMGSDAQGMFAFPALTAMQDVVDLEMMDVRQIGRDLRLRAKPLFKST